MSKRCALVADHDEYFRIVLRALLINKLGFSTVCEAASLEGALEHLSQSPGISLALFELPMPGIRRAADLITVRNSFPATQVAVVSASNRKQDILMALEAGVHGYVPKSIGASQLTSALGLIVDGLIYVPPSVAAVSPSESRPILDTQVEEKPLSDFLTPRQREVLELLMQGKSNKEIARKLKLGEGTIKVHMAALFRVFGVTSRAAAAAAGSQFLSS